MGIEERHPKESYTRRRDPTQRDYGPYRVGDRWVNKATDTVWMLTNKANGIATWVMLGGGGAPLNTLTGDDGFPVTPVGNNINIQGGGTGAILFTTSGAGQLDAAVQVDGTTIAISGGVLSVVGGAFPMVCFSLTTINAVTAETADIPLPDNQASQLLTNLSYIDTGITVGGGALLSSAVIEQAGVFTLLNILDELSVNESPALGASNYEYIAGGAASTMRVRVTGVAGFTLNWRVCVSIISTP